MTECGYSVMSELHIFFYQPKLSLPTSILQVTKESRTFTVLIPTNILRGLDSLGLQIVTVNKTRRRTVRWLVASHLQLPKYNFKRCW